MAIEPYGQQRAGWQTMPLGGRGYWDGIEWWVEETRSQWIEGRPAMEGGVIALHIVLTLLTFWACGGWGWIILLHALLVTRKPGYMADVPTGRYLPVHSDGSPRRATRLSPIPPDRDMPPPASPSFVPAQQLMEPWMYWLGGACAFVIVATILVAVIVTKT